MAKLEQTFASGNEVFLQLGSLAILLTMVVTVLGIKFRWFKHRLSFEPIPTTEVTGIGSVGSYRNSVDQSQLTHGVFRRRDEDENVIERPVSLPPIRVRKTSRGPPPPLLPQKRTVVPMPPGQELIPETPQVEPTTPPLFIPRNKRDKSPQKSPRIQIQEPLYEVKEEVKSEVTFETSKNTEDIVKQRPHSINSVYEEIHIARRPVSGELLEPEVPKRTKRLSRAKSMEVSTETVPVHKPAKQETAYSSIYIEDPVKLEGVEDQYQVPVRKSNKQETDYSSIYIEEPAKAERDVSNDVSKVESADGLNIQTYEIVKSVQFDVEDDSDSGKFFERRDTGFIKIDPELLHAEMTAEQTSSKPVLEEEATLERKIEEKSVHFEIEEVSEEREHTFQRRDTGFVRPDFEQEKSVHFQIYENEKFEREHKFERRDTGFVRPELSDLQKTVTFEGVPDSPEEEYWEIVPKSQTNNQLNGIDQGVVILAEEEEEVLERKEIVPTIILMDADEMHDETEIDALSDDDYKVMVPAPRRSKEKSQEEDIKPTCISFEEEEPQQIAFVDNEDNKSQDSIEIVDEKPDYEKPKIVEFKERPSFLEVNGPERPIPRQRSTTKAPPLPRTPPPTTPDNGNDNWTAIQIHRNLTKELNSEIMAAVLKKSAAKENDPSKKEETKKEPLEEAEPPKNMRDMMRRRRDDYEFSGF